MKTSTAVMLTALACMALGGGLLALISASQYFGVSDPTRSVSGREDVELSRLLHCSEGQRKWVARYDEGDRSQGARDAAEKCT